MNTPQTFVEVFFRHQVDSCEELWESGDASFEETEEWYINMLKSYENIKWYFRDAVKSQVKNEAFLDAFMNAVDWLEIQDSLKHNYTLFLDTVQNRNYYKNQ